ncbi:bifunctional DNA-formamidopyrimidine glycosylase/DNA-(apurinic or apyrimidinic site) lyase [Zwartia panacis]|jgi:formamidopyrimidine-DNA glycosylase|uniref:bifunctional DNA-formamidopyrimidine glycosylase/DNA-(apurinic or apyrimidinic site) lyase n=1 Tax=Zwartia panacis TaxID=2683345 RepID=UPI0025B4FBE8|nr:bifunctional DNA-formamidopyrimidine glycosylase/DNA-(apurinic or apyrimidinic site) lyase [Zwartia panacis]MDN4017589.1 bifunctional DNA-formamidopyrimidine glycosylase/DNA-(apurinic or apyrimidinic site) lyase [Zwartia panacis]
MPELPEVETTRRGIDAVATGRTLRNMIVHESRMRWPIPKDLPEHVSGLVVRACRRRGKYLLIEFDTGTQLIHLGMSGSLRSVQNGELLRKHDHVEWQFDEVTLRLHDPRRFGSVLWHPKTDGPVEDHPLLSKLGIEPFDAKFDAQWLKQGLAGRKVSIKQALLAGDVVVGAGNIYASESLFRARIHPKTQASRVSLARCERLVEALKSTLTDALQSGGSTLRDYVNATGEAGAYFTLHAAVYERESEPCRVCGTPIKRIVQGQRATYFCPSCQKI